MKSKIYDCRKKSPKKGLPLPPAQFGDQSTSGAVDFRLEERTMTRMSWFEKAGACTPFSKSGSIHMLHGASYFIRNDS
jgi:hypothetical protein